MQTIKILILGLLLIFWNSQAAEPLPPNEAFQPRIQSVDTNAINLRIGIPDDYYIYRQRRFAVSSDTLTITAIDLSPGIDKEDAFFGKQSVWYGGKTPATIHLAYENPNGLEHASITVTYQGCLDGVICYPPQTRQLEVTLPAIPNALSASIKNDLFKQSAPSGVSALLKKANGNKNLLSEDQAFGFAVVPLDASTLQLMFRVADGYYLYRDKIKIATEQAHIDHIGFSAGETISDEFHGEQVVYRHQQGVANIYLSQPAEALTLQLHFQGCADIGVCYPIMHRQVHIDNGFVQTQANTPNNTPVHYLQNVLQNNLWAGIGLLLLAGIALSFTPCVLPMLPILLGIITNQRQVSKPRALWLASAYALGVALMMAVFGLIVAKTGVNIQIIMQKPLWLILFASLFIAMGLAMLGVFNVAMPSQVQSRVIAWQNRFQQASAPSMLLVGALSTLIVGPCVAPPLIAVLAFISTTNDSFLGAVYLFALGAGMSLPLVIFAAVFTSVPKTGALSRLVTRVFALLMFGVGLWLLSRLLPGALTLALWGVFMLALAWSLWRSDFITRLPRLLFKGLAGIVMLIGLVWIAGGLMGNNNPIKPLTTVIKLPFKTITDRSSLQQTLANSKQPVMLDLYADWCVSCQEVEHFTLTDAEVVQSLNGVILLKLDITDTNDAHRELLNEYGLIGPPMMLFFKNGEEQRQLRHTGAIRPTALLDKLKRL